MTSRSVRGYGTATLSADMITAGEGGREEEGVGGREREREGGRKKEREGDRAKGRGIEEQLLYQQQQ